jgi:hypothetical protein
MMHSLKFILNLLILFSAPCRIRCSSATDDINDKRQQPEASSVDGCVSYQWDLQQIERYCALEAEADKFLEWTWLMASPVSGPDTSSKRERWTSRKSRLLLEGSMRLNLATSAFTVDQLERHASLQLIHKAKIYFPFWKPTENKWCEFTYMYRVRNSALTNSTTKDDPNYEWPKLSVVLIKPVASGNSDGGGGEAASAGGSLADVRLLDTLTRPNTLARDFQVAVRVGKQTAGSWSLAMLVETRLDSSTFELSEMRLTNCEPNEPSGKPTTTATVAADSTSELVDLKSLFKRTCTNKQDKFQCRLSGRCISLDYRCDFGHDCGPNDDSDEFRCSADFEGRCDFEESTLCQWIPWPRDWTSWHWTSSSAEQAYGGHKPIPDHTYSSDGSMSNKGHYLHLSAHQMDQFRSAQLIGPQVRLKEGHRECKFRFWLQTPADLYGAGMKSAFMSVGYNRINASSLFGANEQPPTAKGNKQDHHGWRRFQVTLFDRRVLFHNVSRYALHVTFGNLLGDLELFAMSSGFIALDDFSFSQGCALSFYNQAPASICGDTEFRCHFAPHDTPGQFCIPLNRVCDFKYDCGRDPNDHSSQVTTDEAACMRALDFPVDIESYPDVFAGGIQVANYATTNDQGESVNEAFDLTLAKVDPTLNVPRWSPFIVRAQYERFKANLMALSGKPMRHMKDVGILLPRFQQAHANCTLELKFNWSNGTRNLFASVYLLRSRTSTLLKRWSSDATSSSSPVGSSSSSGQWYLLGIGEQRSPFNVYIEISFGADAKQARRQMALDTADKLAHFSGQFTLESFKFTDCSYWYGPANVPQAQVIQVADLDDDYDEDFAEDYNHWSAGSQAPVACPSGRFYCDRPMLCIDEQFVCDMQRDCQESGADELDCAASGAIQYDFEFDTDRLMAAGWSADNDAGRQGQSAKWLVGKVNQKLRAMHDLGPPVDHTLGQGSGRYLTLWTPGGGNVLPANGGGDNDADDTTHNKEPTTTKQPDEVAASAWIYMPKMRLLDTCRWLVFHLYNWRPADSVEMLKGDQSVQYEVSARYFGADGEQRDEIVWRSATPMGIEDRWQRVVVELPHVRPNSSTTADWRGAGEFSIGFHGLLIVRPARLTSVLAIDDVALGPKCLLSLDDNAHSGWFERRTGLSDDESAAAGPHTRSVLTWVALTILAAAGSAALLAAYLSQSRLLANRLGLRRQPADHDNLALDNLDV